jgi:uncharacterized repeat protein (TIGR01451 family)
VATLTLLSVGLLYASPTLLTGAAVPLSYVLYGELSSVPADARVSATRSFGRADPTPGEAVRVELTVTNAGDRTLPDVRVVDGVPEALAVTEGSARACLALAPGESATVAYEVVAKRGEHDFDDPVVRLRSLAASERATAEVDAAGDQTLVGANAVREPPMQGATLPRAGTLPTDTGGSGLEFHATRQYRPGDPMTRVDWRHYAKTGDFVTVQYREEQAVRTVVVVDARPVGRVTAARGYPTGAELSAYAAERLYDALEAAGVATSVAAVGVDEEAPAGLVGPDGLAWVDSGDRNRRARADRLFSTVQAAADGADPESERADPLRGGETGAGRDSGPTDPGEGAAAADAGARSRPAADGGLAGGPGELTRRVLARLPPNAQVVLCTPLLDDWPVELARTLAVREYEQVVLSPDVTGDRSVGQRTAAVGRELRLRTVERSGATVVGWNLEQPVDYALRGSLPHLLGR